MMRTLMVLALAILTVMAVAQDEAKETKRYEVALSTDELVVGVDALADVLKEHLKGPSGQYYEIILAKRKAYGAVGKTAGVVFAVALLICLMSIIFAGRVTTARMSDAWVWIATLMGIIAIVFGIVFGKYFGDIIAPEYYALRDVLRTVRAFMP